jgi:hypothetical protein
MSKIVHPFLQKLRCSVTSAVLVHAQHETMHAEPVFNATSPIQLPLKPSMLTALEHGRLHCSLSGACTHLTTLSSLPPVTDALPDVDRSCAALSYYGMYFYRPYGMIVCEMCHSFIPFCFIRPHITNKHRYPKRNMVGLKLDTVLAHIAKGFGIDTKQTNSALDHLTELTSEVCGIKVDQCDQCRACFAWLRTPHNTVGRARMHSLQIHENRNKDCRQSRCDSITDYRTAFVAYLFPALAPAFRRKVVASYYHPPISYSLG